MVEIIYDRPEKYTRCIGCVHVEDIADETTAALIKQIAEEEAEGNVVVEAGVNVHCEPLIEGQFNMDGTYYLGFEDGRNFGSTSGAFKKVSISECPQVIENNKRK